jgi:hypothetical protein
LFFQDISYFCCIELSGPENSLLGALGLVTGPPEKMGPGFDAFLDGRREGSAWIFQGPMQ